MREFSSDLPRQAPPAPELAAYGYLSDRAEIAHELECNLFAGSTDLADGDLSAAGEIAAYNDDAGTAELDFDATRLSAHGAETFSVWRAAYSSDYPNEGSEPIDRQATEQPVIPGYAPTDNDTPRFGSAGGNDDPPPTNEIPTSAEPADRGASLLQLYRYAHAIAEVEPERDEVDDLLADLKMTDLLTSISSDDELPLDPPLEINPGEDNEAYSISDAPPNRTQERANQHNSEALAATGLAFVPSMDGLELEITDPALFTAAIQELHLPEGETGRAQILDELTTTFNNAITDLSFDAINHDRAAAVAACGGKPPASGYVAFSELEPSSGAFAQSLFEHAGELATAVERTIGQAEQQGEEHRLAEHFESFRLLALAHEEGLEVEAAVGRALDLVGCSSSLIGTERYVRADEWTDAFTYLAHLNQIAPHARYTQELHRILRRDLDRALEEPDLTTPSASATPMAQEHWFDMRDKARQHSASILQAASARLASMQPPVATESQED
ncbi:MAG TPA: hypothetical protein VJP80_03005 [Candidatus Saccharimonadales bacterium]|nr:hypothetical protein [Candidatus Saccharimonadales bacterium]